MVILKRLIVFLSLVVLCPVGYAQPTATYPIKNDPFEGCILVTVIGHGVAEGQEGQYHFPADYTLDEFWREKPVPLRLPSSRMHLWRKDDEGNKVHFVWDARKADSGSERNQPVGLLRDGDTIFVSQPIL